MKATTMNNEMKSAVRFTKKRKEPTSQDSRQRGKKSVTFLPSVLVYRTMHINNFTNEEIDNTWWNAEEMRIIVSDCVKIIASMDSNGESATTQCLRGLEFRTPQGQKKRTAKRFCAIDAVLGEQDAQWENGEIDTDLIRASYRVYSKSSQAEAHRIGLEDAQEAMMIYHEGGSCSLVRSSPTTQSRKRVSFTRKSMKLQHKKKFHVSPPSASKSVRTFTHNVQRHSPIGRGVAGRAA